MSQNIIRFVQSLLENVNVPVHFFSLPCEDFLWMDYGLRAALPDGDYNPRFINQEISKLLPNTIYHVADTFRCHYTIFFLPGSGSLMLCGPVLLEEISQEIFLDIAGKMHVPKESYSVLKNYYLHLSCFTAQVLYYNIFTTLGDYIWEKGNYNIQYIDFNALDKWYESRRIDPAAFQEEKLNLPMIEARYALEGRILDAVAKGNEQKAMEIADKLSASISPHGFIYSLRDYKNYTLAFNTLMRKKAEESGVHPMHIDLHSGRNTRQIEHITRKEQCYPAMMDMIHGYCQLVNNYKKTNYSLLTQKIIAYVNNDLTADLSLKAMSERLSVNASYLSALFKKEMGTPLTDYVNRQRMEQAKKLLVITDLPSRSIAQECGICDVYYFNRLFKKMTGYTPKVYRENATREHDPL